MKLDIIITPVSVRVLRQPDEYYVSDKTDRSLEDTGDIIGTVPCHASALGENSQTCQIRSTRLAALKARRESGLSLIHI